VAIFSSQREAEEMLGSFMDHIVTHPQLRPLFVEAATSFRANYADPDVVVSMVSTVDPPVIKRGEDAKAEKVEVDMFMSADDGHKFWLGELNIPMAMARKKIRIEGPVGVLLKLLPAMQPAFGMYRDFLTERGFEEKTPV
jgi:putative sterol carrier protein